MKVTVSAVKNGIQKYVNSEMLPHMDGLIKYGVSVYMDMATENIEEKITSLRDNPMISLLGVIDGENMIDMDRLYQFAANRMDGKILQNILTKTYTFGRDDLDKLYKYITEG